MFPTMTVRFWKNYKESYAALCRIGFPVLVTQLGIIVVSFADTMMVGIYGTDTLAAAAFVNSLFVIPTVMQIGFSQGITPLVGALYGRGDIRGAGRTLRGALHINVLVSVAFTAIMGAMYFFLDRFGQDADLLPIIRGYYLIMLFTLLPMSVFNSFQQTCNGITDTATPMWFILAANVMNVAGNWLLIFGHCGFPELGLAGAGVSTLFARLVTAAGLMAVFTRARRYRPYMEGYSARESLRDIRRTVWHTSYPVMIQTGIECIMWSVGAVVCGWFGKVKLAGYQVVNIIAQLGYMTFLSIGTATSVLVANHTGIGDIRGVRKSTVAGYHLCLALATLASLVFFFFGHGMIGLFTSDEAVIASGMSLILPLVVYQYMDATQLTYVNAIRGTAKVKPLLWISIIAYIVIGTPSLFILAVALHGESLGVYWSFNIALFSASVLALCFYRRIVRRL